MTTIPTIKATSSTIHPRIEGNNICTWIGFKHVMYVVEEAVISHFRQNQIRQRELYENHGLCLEIVDSEARILHALHIDDEVTAEVEDDLEMVVEGELRLLVNLFVERGDGPVKAVVCRVGVQIKEDDSPVTDAVAPTPREDLAPITVKTLDRVALGDLSKFTALQTRDIDLLKGRGEIDGDDPVVAALKEIHGTSMVWAWRIPYFYCHYNERMKHSGYIRHLEEAEDLFLATNGISIRRMLHDKKWIPVVPTARAQILTEAMMEETLYTVYTLVDTYRDFTYTHAMNCYVVRDGKLVPTATGYITHGYARINDRSDWSLVAFDDDTKESIHRNLVAS
ncbi:MAG: hypothetical protein AAFQ51_10390 [Pseudomonadota bacterium]